MTKLKAVHASDTHGFHLGKYEHWIAEKVEEHQPDLFIHSGDFMRHSMKYDELKDFIKWVMDLPFEHKIIVPGNHDVWCENLENNEYMRNELLPEGLHFLINESAEINGFKSWGSPYTSWYYDWGFQLNEHGAEALWPTIPDDTELLVTHGPAKHILDDMYANNELKRQRMAGRKTKDSLSALGCKYLAKRLPELEQLKAHCFGHIHGAYGCDNSHGYVALNSAAMNEIYALTQKPQYFEIEK